jgi:hypothetical protein
LDNFDNDQDVEVMMVTLQATREDRVGAGRDRQESATVDQAQTSLCHAQGAQARETDRVYQAWRKIVCKSRVCYVCDPTCRRGLDVLKALAYSITLNNEDLSLSRMHLLLVLFLNASKHT